MSAGLLLVGASGLAREVIAAGAPDVTGILDDDPALQGREVGGVPVVGTIDDAVTRDERLIVCIGPSAGRARVIARLSAGGLGGDRFATFVADTARVGSSSVVGPGSILLGSVTVTADARIGRHVVVMPGCTITHDDVLADTVTLAAGVALGGSVTIGESAYLGMNAAVRQGVAIGAAATIGMGAVVLGDVPAGETWAGVPARPLQRNPQAEVPARVLGEHA